MNARISIQRQSKTAALPELLLNLGSTLAVVAIVAIVAFLLVRERTSAEHAASRSASNIVKLIDTDVLRNVELYDQSLQGIIATSQHPDLLNIRPELRQQVLFNRAITAPFRGDILWLDKNGDIVADSTSVTARSANFANSRIFQALREDPNLGLVISPPFKAPLNELDWCITFSRRISASDGSFLGVAAGALRLAYFDDLFKSLDIGKDSSVNLINISGNLLARQPSLPGDPMVGHDFSESKNFKRILEAKQGSFTGISARSQHERLYTFSRVGNLPLFVIVAQSTAEVYASWKRTVVMVSVATGLLCIGILWLTLLLGRELRLRKRAEHDLAALASTDSLTGLANRRCLDQTLQLEWARTQRSARPLSVLMVDVDHFKAFNERHGHQGGDEALRNVAHVIEQSIRRPGDLAARYGGEEFLVILPETDLVGALGIAEIIRSSVQAQPPFANDQRPVTVSIGVSSLSTDTVSTLEALLGAADTALYQAKHSGRNQVSHVA
ncbi:sensor domain-containing diguanylate cyclase [Pseudomonas sp. LS1212]|uniref:sensor domain-containing diguanylate cyclase n=1 Tax=Pseudomonas sp. LS1212 TaxID=2972478 RepID=UPI00215D0FAE|nr:sensor domain-containing diguanylate cyclase [Pseudomonas sp. LS1212]UVJ44956.1 sensor domain-containing diguanylate cyclase [Pseudomonas sp. LS1212]